MRVQHSLIQTLLHLLLEEDVQLRLQLSLLVGCQRLRTRLLFDHLGSKAENGLLEAVTKLQVLWQLGELCEEFLPASLG